jgi:hypothetical protein
MSLSTTLNTRSYLMSKRNKHGIKHTGQAAFRRQAEQVQAFFAFANRADTPIADTLYRQECYSPDTKVMYRKHKHVALVA